MKSHRQLCVADSTGLILEPTRSCPVNPYPRIASTAGLADQPGPQTVDQRFGWQLPIVDLCRAAAGTVRCDSEAVRREVGEGVGHVGMILQLLAHRESP